MEQPAKVALGVSGHPIMLNALSRDRIYSSAIVGSGQPAKFGDPCNLNCLNNDLWAGGITGGGGGDEGGGGGCSPPASILAKRVSISLARSASAFQTS